MVGPALGPVVVAGRMSRILAAFGLVAVLFAAAPARGDETPARGGTKVRSAEPVSARFLGSNPIGPLAVVRGGVIETPAESACRTWGPVGSRWRELDAFGRIAGLVTIKRREYYEYSGCDELEVRRVSGHPGAGIYLDAHATYRAPRVEPWVPERSALAALEKLARTRQRDILNLTPAVHVPFAKRAFFFEWSASGERYAVVGGKSLIVASFRRGRWVIAHEEKPEKMRSQEEGYTTLMVTDMNADERPEIVFHTKEASGEWYGDSTLSLGAAGAWRSIGPGIFGSTA